MSTSELLQHPLIDPAAWRGADLARRDDWTIELSDAHRAELAAAIAAVEAQAIPLYEISKGDFPLATLGPELAEALERLEGGLGFYRLRGLPVADWSEDQARVALWGLGTWMGWAEPQDGAGNRMHDVRDIGREFGSDDTIRYFQTSHAIEFHNDGADIFLLFCLRAGLTGGKSRLLSAVELFNEIARRRPDLAVVLQQDFHVDARGQRTDGARCQVLPVYSYYAGQLNVLLKRAYIDSAQRFEEVPRLTEAQAEALELMASIMEEPGLALEFHLEPGDILLASNHVTLHGRTAYDDTQADEGGRHMLRLWLTIPNGRVLPAHYADTREFYATYARRMTA